MGMTEDNVTIAQVAHEHRSKVEREERDWLLARLHHSAHGTWLPESECPTCQQDEIELLREGAPEFNGAFG